MANFVQISKQTESSDKTLQDIITSWLTTFWENKYVRFCLAVGTILTARKILDLVHRKWYRLPPGPVGIPFLGALNEFGNIKNQQTAGKRYGAIFMFNIGFRRTIMINDYNLMTQLFRQKEFTDKKGFDLSKPQSFIVLPMGKAWEERRKLMMHNLITPMNGKILSRVIENAMKQYTFPTIDKLINDNINNKTWFIRDDIKYLTFVTIYGSIFGEPIPCPNDKLLIEYRDLNSKIFAQLKVSFMISTFSPWVHQFVSDYIFNFRLPGAQQCNIIRKWIEMYENNNNNNSNNDNEKNSDSNYYEIIKNSKLSIENGIRDMQASFTAGMHSTAVALEQSILYLAKCGKEYQNELFNEITNLTNINNNNNNSDILSNVTKLPKLRSFIYEILRMHGAILFTLERDISQDIEITVKDENKDGKKIIGNYVIPKGARVYGNLLAINYDSNSKNWGDNFDANNIFEFNPKRFFNQETNEFIGKRQVSTFGSGRRNCAGQQLALRELFLVTSLLIQRYQFDIPKELSDKAHFSVPKSFFAMDTPKIGVSVTLR